MNKLGYYSVLLGIVTLISYGVYMMIADVSMPIIIKIPFLLIIFGAFIIVLTQLKQRKNERSEEDDSRKY